MTEQTPLPVPTALRALARCVARHRGAAGTAPHPPAARAGGHAPAVRGRHARPGSTGRRSWTVRRRATRACSSWSSGCARCTGARARRVPGGEPAQHPAVRRVPRLRVEAVAGARRARGLPRPLRVGRARARPRPTPARSGGCSRWSARRGSIHYTCCPGLRRDDLLSDPRILDSGVEGRRCGSGGGRSRSDERPAGRSRRRCRSDRPGAGAAGPRARRAGPRRGAPADAVPALAGADRASAHAGGAPPARRGRRAAGARGHRPAARLHLGRRVVPVRLGRARPARHGLPAPDPAPPGGRGGRRWADALARARGAGRAWNRAGRARPARQPGRSHGPLCGRRPGSSGRPVPVDRGLRRHRTAPSAGAAGIGWPGGGYRPEIVLADLELDGDLAPGVAHVVAGRPGLLFVFALGERATWRLLATRPCTRPAAAVRAARPTGSRPPSCSDCSTTRGWRPGSAGSAGRAGCACSTGWPTTFRRGPCSSPATPRTPTPPPAARG